MGIEIEDLDVSIAVGVPTNFVSESTRVFVDVVDIDFVNARNLEVGSFKNGLCGRGVVYEHVKETPALAGSDVSAEAEDFDPRVGKSVARRKQGPGTVRDDYPHIERHP